MHAIRKILVPVDFSPGSKLAFDYAIGFAEKLGASVHALHVWEIPTQVRPDISVWAGDVATALTDHAQKEAEARMKAFIDETGTAANPRVSSSVVFGIGYSAILEVAATGFDLIVMGSHGRTGFSRIVLGSVAERIVRHARCPVLTVKGNEPAAEAARQPAAAH